MNYLFTVTRPLDPELEKHFNIPLDTDFEMIWSEKVTTPDLGHHTDRGRLVMYLDRNGGGQITTGNKGNMVVHGFLMWFSFTVLGLVMVGSNRWFNWASDRMQYAHMAVGVVVMVLAGCSISLAIYTVSFKLNDPHNVLGYLTVFGWLVSACVGLASYKIKNRLKWNTKSVQLVRTVHRYTAYTVLAQSYVAVVLGFYRFMFGFNLENSNPNIQLLGLANFVIVAIVLAGFEKRFRKMRVQEDPFVVSDDVEVIS